MKIGKNEFSVEEVLDYEKNRYQRKGYGLVVAILITSVWFLYVPALPKYIWPYKIENQGVFFFMFSYVFHEALFIIINFAFWVIYKLEMPFFERYKVTDRPWPWKEDPNKWNQVLKETCQILFLNHLIFLPILTIGFINIKKVPYRMDYETLPSCFEVIWQTIFSMFVEDFAFYWGHRLLHWDKIYPYIHKMHHKYVNTVTLASEYAHPIEYLLVNVINANLGAIILGEKLHLFTYIMWMTLRIGESHDGHCGYEFSWSPYRLLPMSAGSEYHNFHHVVFKGNYSSFFTYLDIICGTVANKYNEFVAKKLEYEKNRAERVADNQNKKKE